MCPLGCLSVGKEISSKISRSWLGLAAVLAILELVLIYEAVLADMSGSQRIFGVFLGLAILCFAALLYEVGLVFYDQ